jgi:hypothetical protein
MFDTFLSNKRSDCQDLESFHFLSKHATSLMGWGQENGGPGIKLPGGALKSGSFASASGAVKRCACASCLKTEYALNDLELVLSRFWVGHGVAVSRSAL